MATVTIYGASDDLIEIDGDIREEFSHYPHNDGERCFLFFSDGTVLSVQYDQDGVWRFATIKTGSAEMTKTDGVPDDGEEPDGSEPTDRVTLVGDIVWVGIGSAIAS
jgi:hypothetical protein